MLTVLIAMIAGITGGYIFRKYRNLFTFLDLATAWVIRLMLFLLGFGIGGDKVLLAQVPVLGLKGLVLAISSILGSILVSRLILGNSTEYMSLKGTDQSVKQPLKVGSSGSSIWKGVSSSLIAVTAFFLGLITGALVTGLPEIPFDPAGAVLHLLMFMVGLGVGGDSTVFAITRKYGLRLALLPLAVIIGTLGGSLITALLWPALPVRESLAVGAGFGYYSLSSLLIRELSGGDWAAVALLSNISREIITLLTAPLLFRIAGPSAPAAAGGATSMDTTLAAAVQYSGRTWMVPALFSGIVLTLFTPFAVTLILTF